MTTFEVIILIIIYMICYGYVLVMCIEEEENGWFRLLLAIISLVLVIYAPLMIGGMLYKKLEKV